MRTKDSGGAAKRTYGKRVAELLRFKEKHGEFPTRDTDASLERFCRILRFSKNHPEARNHVRLTDEIASALDLIGFEWDKKRLRRRGSAPGKRIREGIADLRRFKEEHGVLPTRSTDASLETFCRRLRFSRNHLDAKNGVRLTDELVAELDSIGFKWKGGGGQSGAQGGGPGSGTCPGRGGGPGRCGAGIGHPEGADEGTAERDDDSVVFLWTTTFPTGDARREPEVDLTISSESSDESDDGAAAAGDEESAKLRSAEGRGKPRGPATTERSPQRPTFSPGRTARPPS